MVLSEKKRIETEKLVSHEVAWTLERGGDSDVKKSRTIITFKLNRGDEMKSQKVLFFFCLILKIECS